MKRKHDFTYVLPHTDVSVPAIIYRLGHAEKAVVCVERFKYESFVLRNRCQLQVPYISVRYVDLRRS